MPVTPRGAVFRALADERRREVLRVVADRELSAGAIAARFPLTRQAVSHHLQALAEAGLVTERRDGRRRLYRARPEGLDELRQYLDGFWAAGLGSLKRAVEQPE